MTRRYFVSDLPDDGGMLPLEPDEAQHALRVMRVQPGDALELFDGQGRQAEGVVHSTDRRNCIVEAKPPAFVDRELGRRIELAVALPKPDRSKELVERLTELGVARLTPIVCARSQRPPSESLLGKMRRAVVESSKQCGRNVLMEIASPIDYDQFLLAVPPSIRLIAHPSGEFSSATYSENVDVVAAVGPEGGFTDEEVASAVQAGFVTVGLGQRIYRIETAACVLAVQLST